MGNAKAVAEIPWREMRRQNLDDPSQTYLGDAAIVIEAPKEGRGMNLLLDSVELYHNDVPPDDNLTDVETTNHVFDLKIIDGYHRVDPTLRGFPRGTRGWDYHIFTYSGNARSVIFNTADFQRVYFSVGDMLILRWRNGNELRVNATVTYRQV